MRHYAGRIALFCLLPFLAGLSIAPASAIASQSIAQAGKPPAVRSSGSEQPGDVLFKIGELQESEGAYPDALMFFDQALQLYRRQNRQLEVGKTLTRMAGLFNATGQYQKALLAGQEAFEISRSLADQSTEASVLNILGLLNSNLGQYQKALKFYQQSLVIYQTLKDTSSQRRVLSNIGAVYDDLAEYQKALQFYQRALVMQQSALMSSQSDPDQRFGEAVILNNIGSVYFQLQQYDKAMQLYQQSLKLYEQISDSVLQSVGLTNLATVYQKLDQPQQALELLQQALALSKTDSQQTAVIHLNLGTVYENLGRYLEAENSFRTTIALSESQGVNLSDANKVSWFETQARAYQRLQKNLIQQNKIESALEIAERGRARAFVDLLATRLPLSLTVRRSPDSSSTSLKVEVGNAFPTGSNIPQPPVLNSLQVKGIQAVARTQDAVLVQYSLITDAQKRDTDLLIWVIQPSGEIAFRQVDLQAFLQQGGKALPVLVSLSRDSIGARGLRFNEAIATSIPEPQTVNRNLQQLYQLLIQPIADLLPADPRQRVIFIPQSSLFFVPFAALQDASGAFLIEKHTLLMAPSIQTLALTHESQRIREFQRVLNNNPDQVITPTQILPRSSLLTRISPLEILIVGNPTMPNVVTTLGDPPQPLSSLPGAEREANEIASLLKTKAMTGKQATETDVVERMAKARVIHLATHGLLDDFKGLGIPGAIALAPTPDSDGLLTAAEILNLKLNADLVVLSACDTGRGNLTGDGVIGLSRSLISAGSASVIVSLWQVPDTPTATLMTAFYKNLQETGDKAQALRQAMLSTKEQFPDPLAWAAFTLIGEAN